MLVALMSDAHDERDHLHHAVRQALAANCCHLIFLGDLATLETLRLLRAAWPYAMDLVPGNNDYPLADFLSCARLWPNTTFHPSATDITLANRRLYLTHVPTESLRVAAATGEFDALFFGHTHVPEQRTIGPTLLANPGDIQGRFGSPSFAIYDTLHNSVKHFSISSKICK